MARESNRSRFRQRAAIRLPRLAAYIVADTATNIHRDHPPTGGSCALLVDLVQKYFEAGGRRDSGRPSRRDYVASQTSLRFHFFTGSTSSGKVIARAAAENLTPVLLSSKELLRQQ
jgi:acyl-CoA reductase-like NAD-dependent aldehyde dehydrogenase